MSDKATRWIVYEASEVNVPKINPELAKEIGLNESLVFLQMAFWLRTSQHDIDGRFWVYKSAADIQSETFPYLTRQAVTKILDRLVEKHHLLDRRNDLNKRAGDTTYWYALNVEYVSRLTSVALLDKAIQPKTEATKLSTEATELQGGATELSALPDITPDTTTRESAAEAAAASEPQSTDIAKPAKPRKATAWEPHFNALVTAFGLQPATLTKTAAGLYWKVAKELYDTAFPPERIPDLYRYVREMSLRGDWTSFTVATLAKYAADFSREQPAAPQSSDAHADFLRRLLGPNTVVLNAPSGWMS